MEPTPKRKLSRKQKVDTMSASRFNFPTSPKADELKRKIIPKNTDKCTQWLPTWQLSSCIWHVCRFWKLLNVLYVPCLLGVYG